MGTNMERIVRFEPAWDERHPDPMKDRGIGAVKIRFVLKGTRGAIQFLLYTDWYLPESQMALWNKKPYFAIQPGAWDIGYHSPEPKYEGQEPIEEACEWLDNKPCYYDGSSLAAVPIRDALLREGDAAVWARLEREYVEVFGELA